MQVEALQLLSHLLHELVLTVIDLGVGPHQSHIGVELLRLLVYARLQLELDGLQVDGTADCLVVVGCTIAHLIDWLQEWQDFLVRFQPPQDGAFPVKLVQLLGQNLGGGFSLQFLDEFL